MRAPTDEENVAALKSAADSLRKTAGDGKGEGAAASRRLADDLTKLADSNEATRNKAQAVFVDPLKIMLEQLKLLLQAQPVSLKTLPADLVRSWQTKEGITRVEALPKGDPDDNDNLRKFANAVLAAEPNAIGGPVSILKSGDTVVKAFIHAGFWALLSISLLLWLALRRITDVLLTLVPLLVAGAVTLEICVLIGLPLNFANIVALPLLLGVGVAFKIYYVTAWRSGRTNLLQSSLTRAIFFSATDDGHGVRQPVAVEPSGHREHGQAAGVVACHHARRGAAVSAGPNGQTARCREGDRYRRRRHLRRPRSSGRARLLSDRSIRSFGARAAAQRFSVGPVDPAGRWS